MKFIVITTINQKTEAILRFQKICDWHIIIVGDLKSAPINSSENLTFLSIQDQAQLGYEISRLCPYNHYTRKNIGYLYAIQQGADIIYDTDDDNLPYDSWFIEQFYSDKQYTSERKFVNIYKYFTQELIWPRGYPLDEINQTDNHRIKDIEPLEIGVWQGLADIDPDVDAIFRLVLKKDIKFEEKPSISLAKNYYCPFNSQNTVWNKKAFPYLYLPATTSFRFTDILRGYIAQRLMWQQNLHLGFTKATVYQERNAHDFMKDFADEWECYLNVKPIVKLLDSLDLTNDSLVNLERVYFKIAEENFIKQDELPIFQAWVSDFKRLMTGY
jgi:hypothetical protein